ncbi:MAG: class I SAM-dependent methyltransferase [Myxococcales bacterium]|nr:class I SAM-dependent methyltransferase [Myxococcales bacterium]
MLHKNDLIRVCLHPYTWSIASQPHPQKEFLVDKEPQKYDWSNKRGEKWCEHLSKLEAMLKPVDAPLTQALRLDAPYRIADVACGGGGTTSHLRSHAPEGSVVHGFDISQTLIHSARSRTPHKDISFEVVDISKTPPPQGAYDRLLSRFGTMFFEDPSAAFRNLRAWLSPEGRFVFATWAPPQKNRWATLARDVVGEIVELPTPDPDAPGPFRYADADKLLPLLEQAGFSKIEVNEWNGSLALGGGLSLEETAQFVLSAFSFFREALAKAGEPAIQKARTALTERFSDYQKDGMVWMEANVLFFTGT